MKCAEVRRWIVAQNSRADDDDPRVREHLAECRSCAAFAREAAALQSSLSELQATDADGGISMAAMRARVESLVDGMSRWEKIMSRTKETLQRRPALIAGVSLTVMIVAFACLVPIPYQQVAGYRIALPGWDKSEGTLMAAAVSAMSSEDVYYSTEKQDDSTVRVVIDVPRSVVSKESEDVMVRVLPKDKVVSIEPYYVVQSKPLLTRLLAQSDRMLAEAGKRDSTGRRVAVRVQSLREMLQSVKVTDEEVAMTINNLLERLGVTDSVDVAISTDEASGQRLISLTAATADQEMHEGVQLEIMIDDGSVVATRASTSQWHEGAGAASDTTAMLIGCPIMIKVKLKDVD